MKRNKFLKQLLEIPVVESISHIDDETHIYTVDGHHTTIVGLENKVNSDDVSFWKQFFLEYQPIVPDEDDPADAEPNDITDSEPDYATIADKITAHINELILNTLSLPGPITPQQIDGIIKLTEVKEKI